MMLQQPRALEVLLVTDGLGVVERIETVVAAAARAGVRAVQVREPRLTARELASLCDRLRALLDPLGGLVFVNDRLDVAAAGHAHGAHLGSRSVPWATARRALPGPAPLGCSAHDAAELQAAAAAGADFATLSPVLPTSCKPGAPVLGPRRAADLTAAAPLPVVWLGGLSARSVARLPPAPGPGPAGVAVRSALFAARDPGAAAAELLAAVRSWRSGDTARRGEGT